MKTTSTLPSPHFAAVWPASRPSSVDDLTARRASLAKEIDALAELRQGHDRTANRVIWSTLVTAVIVTIVLTKIRPSMELALALWFWGWVSVWGMLSSSIKGQRVAAGEVAKKMDWLALRSAQPSDNQHKRWRTNSAVADQAEAWGARPVGFLQGDVWALDEALTAVQ